MQEQRACDILRYAISLHVLRPEDLEETQTLAGDDPVSKLISLQREEWIRPDAVGATSVT